VELRGRLHAESQYGARGPREHPMKVLIALEVHPGEKLPVSAAAARPWPSASSFCLLHSNVPLNPPMLIPRLFA